MGNKNTDKKYNEDFKKMIVDLYNSGSFTMAIFGKSRTLINN